MEIRSQSLLFRAQFMRTQLASELPLFPLDDLSMPLLRLASDLRISGRGLILPFVSLTGGFLGLFFLQTPHPRHSRAPPCGFLDSHAP